MHTVEIRMHSRMMLSNARMSLPKMLTSLVRIQRQPLRSGFHSLSTNHA